MKYRIYNIFKGHKISQKWGWTSYAKKMWKRYQETGKRLYRYGVHSGVDISVPIGTPLKSPLNGKIVKVDRINDSGIGKNISIADYDQLIACRIYHLSDIYFRLNQSVIAGQITCVSGNTGIGTAPHAHIEFVRIDKDGKVIIDEYGGSFDPFNKKIVELIDL